MPLLYRYIDKRDNTVKYVGISGTKGRPDGVVGLALRDAEHFSIENDPIYQSGTNPDDYRVQYVDDLTECEALAYETACIGYYNPVFNRQKKGLGTFRGYERLNLEWKDFQRPNQVERKEKREAKRANGKARGRVLSNQDINRLMQTVRDNSGTKERDMLIIALILFTGMRVSDVTQLRKEDYNRANGTIRICRTGEDIPLGGAQEYLENLLAHSKPGGKYLFASGRFASQKNGMSVKTIQWMVRKYGEKAEIENCTVATLRETFAEHVRQSTYSNANRQLFVNRKEKRE